MRTRHRNSRKPNEPVFEIDVRIPGLAEETGRASDRFRCSAGVRDAKQLKKLREMVVDLGKRLLFDVLGARLDGRITTEELAHAYSTGDSALKRLAERVSAHPLVPLIERYLREKETRGAVSVTRRHLLAFVDYCAKRASPMSVTTRDFTTPNVRTFLSKLTDRRAGRSGRQATSNTPEAIATRRRRKRAATKLEGTGKPQPRAVKGATVNRYRASLCGFASFLVQESILTTHPIANKKVKARPEGDGRMPTISAEEWDGYCAALQADLLAPEGSVDVARVLRFTGADVGEVLGYINDSGVRQPGFIVRDIDETQEVPRIRFKRQKVTESRERSVPFAQCWTDDLKTHIAHFRLRKNDEVFTMVDRRLFEAAHERAVGAIDRPDIRLKDFRHFAAQSWAAANARLEQIKEWLGHSSINQTVIYSRFLPADSRIAAIVEAGAQPHPPGALTGRAGDPPAAG